MKMNLDINLILAEYDQRLADLQRENLILKAQVKQLQQPKEETPTA